MSDPLREDLRSFAGHMDATDLHDKVLRRSRNLGIRRAVVSAAAALALVAAGITGAVALASNTGPEQSAQSGLLSGTFYYYVPDPDGGGDDTVMSWRVGEEPRVVATGDAELLGSAAFSPDGTRLATAESFEMEGVLMYRLMIHDLTTGSSEEFGGSWEYGDLCLEPAWSADSAALLLWHDSSRELAQYVDVATEEPRGEPFTLDGCHAQVVGEGELAGSSFFMSDSQLELMTLSPDGVVKATGLGGKLLGQTGQEIVNLGAVSPDGQLVCVGTTGNGLGRERNCATVMSTVDGRIVVSRPHTANSTYLFAGQDIVSRAQGMLSLLARDGTTTLDVESEPPALAEGELLAYLP